MQGIHLRKYGVAATIDFELYEVDGVDFRVDWTPAAGDVFMMRDEAAEEQVTNAGGNADLSTLVADEGRAYSITLALEDMQAARVVVYLVDQATKAFLDKVLVIETYGHASAQHAIDLDDGVRAGLTALPNAAADAAGGLPISDDGGLDMDSILEKMLAYVRLLARSDAAVETDAATELTAINADEASGAGNFSSQTDAVEAIRDVAPHGSAMVGTNSANTTVPDAAGTAAGLHTTTDALLATIGGYLDTEIAAIVAAVITNAAGTDIAADIIALKGETASIQAETTAIKAIVDWFRSASGTVVVNNPGTDTIFDLTAVVGTLSADAAAFKNMEITIFDNSGSVYQTRKISTWDGPNLRATLDAALTFPVQNGVDTFVLWNKYSPTAAAGSGATVAEIMAAALAGYTTEGTAGNALRQLRHYF